ALESDTITHRIYDFQGNQVLELVRPYNSPQYSFGLFRVGLSLQRYAEVSRGFDRQLLTLSGSLIVIMLVLLLYFNSRRRRHEITRRYSQIKSVTDRILQQMAAGVIVIDSEGTIGLANTAAEKLLGRHRLLGQSWAALVNEASIPLPTSPSALLTLEGHEFRMVGSEQTRTLVLSSSMVGGEGEWHDAVVLVMSDITTLKEYEQQVARRERLSEMGTLAAGVAHEIRNPLNTIAIAAQRLAEEFTPDHDVEAYTSFTQRIRSEARRLNEIISRFLALARNRDGGMSAVSLDAFMKSMKGLLSDAAAAAHIELTFDFTPGLVVRADEDKLTQVFHNLFNNSRDALAGREGRIAVTARAEGAWVTVRFTDDGPGIPDELKEKVITPFFTTRESGTGLGLATVYRIVQDFGGEMAIESAQPHGTTVVLKFRKFDRTS
ncbi:MAG: PAS domain-containing protein, partial [Candidatus Zixiibacteriota bacterium]